MLPAGVWLHFSASFAVGCGLEYPVVGDGKIPC
jgi:hypothetical protein